MRRKGEFGDLPVFLDPNTGYKYIMKELVFYSETLFQDTHTDLQRIKNCASAFLLPIVDISAFEKSDKLSKQYVLRAFYEFHPNNLQKETARLQKLGHNFSQEEITMIIVSCVNGLAALQEIGLSHYELTPDSVVVTEDRRFLVCDRISSRCVPPQNIINNLLATGTPYVAPEVYEAIKSQRPEQLEFINYNKADLFLLGLCVLRVGLQTSISGIYDHKSRSFL